MNGVCNICTFLGRLSIGALFVWAGVGKFTDYEGVSTYMAMHGMTMIPLFLILAMVVEILAGVGIILGYKTRLSAAFLIIYLTVVTVVIHNFWTLNGEGRTAELISFMRNVGIIGGLFYVLGCGAGRWAFDCCCCSTSSCETAKK